jgi:anionic cell wall polymer biosynthesis LytR-Cps2A-Psr (LCP) family protein
MSRKTIAFVAITVALIVVLAGGLAYAVLTFVSRPLNKPLTISASSTPAPTRTPASAATRAPTKTPANSAPTATTEPPVTYLVLGIDVDGQAEAIYVMTTDPASDSIEIVGYSPSLSVTVKGLEALGISQTEFKMVYANALSLPGGDADTATSLMAQALADNFGITPDHYLSMNEEDLAAQIDAIGGIDVNIPVKFGEFEAGEQHLDGTAAWHYVAAIDHPGIELEVPRIERQRQVLQAILDKFYSPAIVPRIPGLVQVAVQGKLVKSDLSISEILTLANFIQQAPEDQIHFTVWTP